MKIIKITFISIVIMMLLTGCYVPARKVYHFETNHTDKIWLNGKELIKLEENKIEIIISFDHTLNGVASFDLSMSNKTNDTFLIDPIEFYCVFTNKFKEENKSNALDPEVMLFESAKQIEKYHARNLSNSRTELLFSLFDIAEDIHNRNKSDEEKNQDEEDREQREQTAERRQASNIERINQITSNRNFIENNALRKTTLFPSQTINGKLFFHLVHDIEKLILYLPVGDRLFELEYERKSF